MIERKPAASIKQCFIKTNGQQTLITQYALDDVFACASSTESSQQPQQIVMCLPPLGQEYYRTHRLLRQLASKISRVKINGELNCWAAMRFDPLGQGDSSGEFEQLTLTAYLQTMLDIMSAVEACRPVSKWILLGIRTSASIALAFHRLHPVRGLILIDPILDGGSYQQQLSDLHQAFLSDSLRFSKPRQQVKATFHQLEKEREASLQEYIGHRYCDELLQEISAWTPQSLLGNGKTKKRLWFCSDDRLQQSLLQSLQQQGHPRIEEDLVALKTDPGWFDVTKIDKALLLPELLEVLPDHLKKFT